MSHGLDQMGRVMAISGDYSTPVMVNGFNCRNCTDVSYAKKFIDPGDPKAGPFGLNATQDSRPGEDQFSLDRSSPITNVAAMRLLDIRA